MPEKTQGLDSIGRILRQTHPMSFYHYIALSWNDWENESGQQDKTNKLQILYSTRCFIKCIALDGRPRRK